MINMNQDNDNLEPIHGDKYKNSFKFIINWDNDEYSLLDNPYMTLEAYRASYPWTVEKNDNLKLTPCGPDEI